MIINAYYGIKVILWFFINAFYVIPMHVIIFMSIYLSLYEKSHYNIKIH